MSLSVERVREILHLARTKRILVAGDLMLDEYLWGEVTRISPEAPVPVVRVTGESCYPGGAANVARNVRTFSAWTGALGVIGDDDAGRRLSASLTQAGIDIAALVRDARHPTIVKTRIIAKHQQVVRVDRETAHDASPGLAPEPAAALDKLIAEVDGIILSDYAKGFLSQPFIDKLKKTAQSHGTITTVDPSPLNPVDWSGVTAIKPNRMEALRAAGLHELAGGMPDDIMVRVGQRLLDTWSARMVLLTMGEEGMLLFERGRDVFHTPTRAREVFDVSGAGDTAIAVFTVALCAGAQPWEAAELANAASGIAVGKLGTATVTAPELIADFETAR